MKPSRLFLILGVLVFTSCQPDSRSYVSIDKTTLADKIKGGWAGQVIGCTYGGPTEFRYTSTIIPPDTIIPWDDTRMKWYFDHAPGLYDDVYMDLTFVEVFKKEGLDAPVMSHASAFAEAENKLWHANQAARYNILQGIKPPESGHWLNNPHADDIDFQIEADFAGLMSPGMVNAATTICDSIGHIMNYGDGWYGGVFVAAMYALAFIEDDVHVVVEKALSAIPEQSTFYQCIRDVIQWTADYPDDWTLTWQACEDKWGIDIGCPDGVYSSFNIDAKINAAYIVIGLLYGQGDFGKTIDISTRCGQDSDCNPASAAGILGTMLGYNQIPPYWKKGLSEVEHIDFKYTTLSLLDVYQLSFDQALANLFRNGALVDEHSVQIPAGNIRPVRFEQAFEGIVPIGKKDFLNDQNILSQKSPNYTFTFDGVGFVVRGSALGSGSDPVIQVKIDGKMHEQAVLPLDFTTRRHEVTWAYGLNPGEHDISIELVYPENSGQVLIRQIIFYGSRETKKTD